ncbi:CDC42 small effector protein 1-like [Oryx dammah]|uniref:CDC42 small effector protein 1-like n=1 Tax=Oryx dammah TaxID=59534 RepID=UPI001A9AC148|nr:CDC42 small effector protein 1-like [Oryx dammah]
MVKRPQSQKKRRWSDWTMTGEPVNFAHLTHIGSGEGDGLAMTDAVQEQIRSKGN